MVVSILGKLPPTCAKNVLPGGSELNVTKELQSRTSNSKFAAAVTIYVPELTDMSI